MTVCDNCGKSFYLEISSRKFRTSNFNYCCFNCRTNLYHKKKRRKEISKALESNTTDELRITVRNLVKLGFKVEISR